MRDAVGTLSARAGKAECSLLLVRPNFVLRSPFILVLIHSINMW